VFLNPPYGKQIADWCAKLHEEADRGVPVIALLPCGARFSTEYWQTHVLTDQLTALCFLNQRLKFRNTQGEEQAGNPYDSTLYGFNVEGPRFVRAFAPLGKVLVVAEVAPRSP
jgi:hypothetical protein